ncbi:Ser-Thr-rich glycosyl-phosphatidyl-inositol-anchored membrane family [Legionella pneumophila]|nr:Ser-Thr-rich glycosyl-phosphatidyl-inositol-anchored membrane family [Legionella pneumophila]
MGFTMIRTFLTAFLMLLCSLALAQEKVVTHFFKEVNSSIAISEGKANIQASQYRVVDIDVNQLYAELENAPHRDGISTGIPLQLELPQPDGTVKRYQVMENSTLAPELSTKFPEIKTYDAYGVDNPGELVKFDLTPQGFHAMILSPGRDTVFIDPLIKGNTQYYMIYYKKDFITSKKMKCGVKNQNQPLINAASKRDFTDFNPCVLKKYRLALAATAQYTQFHGGTVPQALAAETTTVNRVNGIFEIDMAITMQIIANNNLIIYTDPNTQPYTSGDPDKMIGENQANIDKEIGAANYDIGHVVDAAGSGLAQTPSVCINGEKAMGVTGQSNPVGDPFDVGYVAHEIGHQFGANHVQNNNCQRNNPTAVEPGSGSTIMSYAGICDPNVQDDSDPYFNGISLQEMGDFVSDATHTCPVKTSIPSAPVIQGTNGGVKIPAQTPFALTATATKIGGNEALTFAWEQQNNEASQQPPVSTSRVGPNFRSFSPQVSGTRYFPNLNALANNGPFTWEVLPSVSRTLKFRVTVRRNTPGGSCNAYTDTTLSVESKAGPFVVTNPTESGITWTGISPRTVTWDVANTNLPPINARFVNILLSIDGGQTFPFTLLSNVDNTGNEVICVPNLNSSTARIMVQASNGTFFNVSKNNLTIIPVPPRPPELTRADRNPMDTSKAFVLYANCIPTGNDVYTVNGLPPGATVRFDANNRRFIIENINTPKRVRNVTITATDENGVSRTSNAITIPSIL